MKKAFDGRTEDIVKEIERYLKDKKNEYDFYQVVVEILDEN